MKRVMEHLQAVKVVKCRHALLGFLRVEDLDVLVHLQLVTLDQLHGERRKHLAQVWLEGVAEWTVVFHW